MAVLTHIVIKVKVNAIFFQRRIVNIAHMYLPNTIVIRNFIVIILAHEESILCDALDIYSLMMIVMKY